VSVVGWQLLILTKKFPVRHCGHKIPQLSRSSRPVILSLPSSPQKRTKHCAVTTGEQIHADLIVPEALETTVTSKNYIHGDIKE
jgi:hypothetical protein